MANDEERRDPAFYEGLGRAVQVLRTARGLARKDLARLSGISYPYLSEIENVKKRPSSKALLAIARALRIRPHELLEAAEGFGREAGDEAGAFDLAEPSAAAGPLRAAALAAESGPESRWFGGTFAPGARARPAPPSARRTELLAELEALLERMPDPDLERLLDLARRLLR